MRAITLVFIFALTSPYYSKGEVISQGHKDNKGGVDKSELEDAHHDHGHAGHDGSHSHADHSHETSKRNRRDAARGKDLAQLDSHHTAEKLVGEHHDHEHEADNEHEHGEVHSVSHDHEHHDEDHDHEHRDHEHHDHEHEHHDHEHEHHDHDHEHRRRDQDGATTHHSRLRDYKIWLAATGSILIIGCCGLFGVMVIPIMQRRLYQHCLQFLIALAVGTLAGDALLHLFPHAMMAAIEGEHGGHNHEGHQKVVYLGLIAAVSIVGFFLFEKSVNVMGEMRASRKQNRQSERTVRVVREGHVPSDKAVGERVCNHKYSSYCAADFDLEAVKTDTDCSVNGTPRKIKSLVSRQLDPGCEKTLLPAISDSVLNIKNSNYIVGNGSKVDGVEEQDTVIISHHEVTHHGHSHAHSHLHSAPNSISSVALMVIFGDGIHNLADGLAIGAAFADGMLSGFSTSVAVLCHELPHEIGDFAMLLKTGMSVKRAIFYNVVSSVLAFIGMVLGFVLGNLENFSSWMFAATAGVFLYVALVDMMPELNSGHSHPLSGEHQHEGVAVPIILQMLGMLVGVGIMALIALYEDDLKDVFADL